MTETRCEPIACQWPKWLPADYTRYPSSKSTFDRCWNQDMIRKLLAEVFRNHWYDCLFFRGSVARIRQLLPSTSKWNQGRFVECDELDNHWVWRDRSPVCWLKSQKPSQRTAEYFSKQYRRHWQRGHGCKPSGWYYGLPFIEFTKCRRWVRSLWEKIQCPPCLGYKETNPYPRARDMSENRIRSGNTYSSIHRKTNGQYVLREGCAKRRELTTSTRTGAWGLRLMLLLQRMCKTIWWKGQREREDGPPITVVWSMWWWCIVRRCQLLLFIASVDFETKIVKAEPRLPKEG